MDETWVNFYCPEVKQQSLEWRPSGSPIPKKFRAKESLCPLRKYQNSSRHDFIRSSYWANIEALNILFEIV